jgi:hypothetical protein
MSIGVELILVTKQEIVILLKVKPTLAKGVRVFVKIRT